MIICILWGGGVINEVQTQDWTILPGEVAYEKVSVNQITKAPCSILNCCCYISVLNHILSIKMDDVYPPPTSHCPGIKLKCNQYKRCHLAHLEPEFAQWVCPVKPQYCDPTDTLRASLESQLSIMTSNNLLKPNFMEKFALEHTSVWLELPKMNETIFEKMLSMSHQHAGGRVYDLYCLHFLWAA